MSDDLFHPADPLRFAHAIERFESAELPVGTLDITLYRDDLMKNAVITAVIALVAIIIISAIAGVVTVATHSGAARRIATPATGIAILVVRRHGYTRSLA